MSLSVNEKIKSSLAGLGRATLRGIRRCPKCGIYNGTRGLKCKYCYFLLKGKPKYNADACKLVTRNSTQIYSVYVQNKGPDHRGFVQLENLKKSTENFVLAEGALCFVESCQRLFDSSILKCHETDQSAVVAPPMCEHIKAAIDCHNEAVTLDVNHNTLKSLDINAAIKQEIYQIMSQSTAPLVQRVTKNSMAVKCQYSPKHPLSYLHFTFYTQKLKDRVENKFRCSCKEFKDSSKSSTVGHSNQKPKVVNEKCVHFYCCISAFASDSKLTDEFSAYVNMVGVISDKNDLLIPIDNQLVSMLENNSTVDNEMQYLELNDTSLLIPCVEHIPSVIDQMESSDDLTTNSEVLYLTGTANNTITFTDMPVSLPNLYPIDPLLASQTCPKKKTKRAGKAKNKKETPTATVTSLRTNLKPKKVPVPKKIPMIAPTAAGPSVEEKNASFTFIEWLGSVTERINQTMHYQFSGKPDPLVFHVSQLHFELLRDRLSNGTKKRLPNRTTAFIRKNATPLGTFTKYSWHITNILHLISIFHTPQVELQVCKSFERNKDGTYKEIASAHADNAGVKMEGLIPIKPVELKTYLKVGYTSNDQTEPTPFVIDWIPDILPISKIGELTLRFSYGHQGIPRSK